MMSNVRGALGRGTIVHINHAYREFMDVNTYDIPVLLDTKAIYQLYIERYLEVDFFYLKLSNVYKDCHE